MSDDNITSNNPKRITNSTEFLCAQNDHENLIEVIETLKNERNCLFTEWILGNEEDIDDIKRHNDTIDNLRNFLKEPIIDHKDIYLSYTTLSDTTIHRLELLVLQNNPRALTILGLYYLKNNLELVKAFDYISTSALVHHNRYAQYTLSRLKMYSYTLNNLSENVTNGIMENTHTKFLPTCYSLYNECSEFDTDTKLKYLRHGIKISELDCRLEMALHQLYGWRGVKKQQSRALHVLIQITTTLNNVTIDNHKINTINTIYRAIKEIITWYERSLISTHLNSSRHQLVYWTKIRNDFTKLYHRILEY